MAESDRPNPQGSSTASRSGQRRDVHRPSRAKRSPHFSQDTEVNERLRELESSGEPISIAEQISREEIRPMTSQERADVNVDDMVNVTELQRMKIDELVKHAQQAGVDDPQSLSKRDLIVQILKWRVKSRGLMYGEGTLQILPDGFGFLRSPEYHYLSCPDDIYVSPSQIRKFNLRNGAVVSGQIRPPKENERYFALLRVETVNGLDPNDNARRIHFDELTPLHPDKRIMMEHDFNDMSTRVVDMIAPIGFGQRGLIVSPPRAGKTILMQKMAQRRSTELPGSLRHHAFN